MLNYALYKLLLFIVINKYMNTDIRHDKMKMETFGNKNYALVTKNNTRY